MGSMNMFHSNGQPLDSRQLRAFVALANLKSFTGAGREIGISQSAISHSVRALEEDLGCRLLSRTGKSIHLTPIGEHLLHYAQRILSDMAAARDTVVRLKSWGQNRLRIGASPGIARHFLPPVLESFWREMRELPVSVENAGQDQCVDLLQDKLIDVAVALHPREPVPMHITSLFVDEVAWVVAPGHPWAVAGKVRREEITSQPVATCSRSCPSFGTIEGYFARDNHRLRVVYEAGDIEALKSFVAGGRAATLLAAWEIRGETAAGTLVSLPLGRRPLRRQWCALRAATDRPGLAEATFLKQAVEYGAQFPNGVGSTNYKSETAGVLSVN